MTANKMYQTNNFNYTPHEGNLYSSSWLYDNASKLKDNYSSFVTMENQSNPQNEDDVLEGLFKDRLRFQKLSTLQALYLIMEREHLRDKNISSIKSRIMYCQENLSRLHMWLRQPDSRSVGGLQRLVCDLEKQKMDEATSSWKDTLELKLSLLDKIQGYQNLKRQEALLEDVS